MDIPGAAIRRRHVTGDTLMAEEETPEEVPQEEAEVEGHAIEVEEFNADGRNLDVHCGAYYSDS
jgi:hypothetical protein